MRRWGLLWPALSQSSRSSRTIWLASYGLFCHPAAASANSSSSYNYKHCLCGWGMFVRYAGCGEGAGDHCWIRSEYMIGRVSRLSRHISGVHRDTRPQFPVSGQCHTFTSDRYYWQSVTVAAPAAYYSVYLGWLILRSAQADGILEKFPNFWNSNSVFCSYQNQNIGEWKMLIHGRYQWGTVES